MTRQGPVYFSIINGDDIVRIEVLGAVNNPEVDVQDGHRLAANIRMKRSAFRCHYNAEFMINDFYVLRK